MSRKGRPPPEVDHVQDVMQKFVREFPDVVLLGGWATYLRTGVAKSHDIDVIVDHATLDRLRAQHQLSSSRHVSGRKFEFRIEGIAVDVYPIYQSKLGQRLQVPVEALIGHSDKIDRVRVLTAEAQFVAKMAALLDRPDTLPGEKDRREMLALLNLGKGLDFSIITEILRQSGWQGERQAEVLGNTFDLLIETENLTNRDRLALRLNRATALDASRTTEGRDHELER